MNETSIATFLVIITAGIVVLGVLIFSFRRTPVVGSELTRRAKLSASGDPATRMPTSGSMSHGRKRRNA